RRGIEVLSPDVNESGADCDMDEGGGVRIGLGYVRGVREQEVKQLASARLEGGQFRSLSDLASRAGAGAPSLELLAWSGACDSLVEGEGAPSSAPGDARAPSSDLEDARAPSTDLVRPPISAPGDARAPSTDLVRPPSSARRIALWQLGVATPGRNVPGGTQLALPLDLPAPPRLRELSAWETMLADYGTTGLTVDAHPMALLRHRMPAGSVTSQDLEVLEHGSRIRIGGLVVARQRPGTANGIVFILLEDEFGTINLIVPPEVYERNRLTVRTEPLMMVEGKLERFAAAGGAINVLVDKVGSIAAPDRLGAEIKDFSMLDEQVRRAREAERTTSDGARGGPWTSSDGRPDGARGGPWTSNDGRRDGARSSGDHPSDGPETDAEDFRAVAPPVMSFASGRRR